MQSLHHSVALLPIVWIVLLLAVPSIGFTAVSPTFHHGVQSRQSTITGSSELLISPLPKDGVGMRSTPANHSDRSKPRSVWNRIVQRFDTVRSAGLPEHTQMAGLFGRTVKKIHDPITYLVLALVAGFRYDWCFKSMVYWFGVAFCVKWYRARYVFKIPVWDRQPNWNNVITSKEQEKNLKAFTCKKCGSTIFIAKTREFFFEGNTGIGGLGCFACGAKGKENFVMDRERIVEDVADIDDYFDYERPLDFVSRAERRKIMKEAKGNEELANQLLVDRANATAGVTVQAKTTPSPENVDVDVKVEATSDSPENVDVDVKVEATSDSSDGDDDEGETTVESLDETEIEVEATADVESEDISAAEPAVATPEPAKEAPTTPAKASKAVAPPSNEDDLGVLGLD